jgi:hypothetical protein
MSRNPGPEKRKAFAQLIESGPVWITAISGLIVAMAAAGFLVVTNPSDARPSISPNASRPSVTAPPATSPSRTPTPTPGPAGNNTAGTQLGHYIIYLPGGYSVPLNATKPTRLQFHQGSQAGDLFDNGRILSPGSFEKMATLPGGTTPTYQACNADTAYAPNGFLENVAVGTSFCIFKPGEVIGAIVINIASNDIDVTLNVTVWRS